MPSRFTHVVLFHGKGDLPNGRVAHLETILKEAYPDVQFARPFIPDFSTDDAISWLKCYVSAIKPGSLIIGLERGGLLACAMQEAFPTLNLSVIAINAPTIDGNVMACPPALKPGQTFHSRVALYSHLYQPIRGNCDWQVGLPSAQIAFDLEWLANGKNHHHALCYIISAFMQGNDLHKTLATLFPTPTK